MAKVENLCGGLGRHGKGVSHTQSVSLALPAVPLSIYRRDQVCERFQLSLWFETSSKREVIVSQTQVCRLARIERHAVFNIFTAELRPEVVIRTCSSFLLYIAYEEADEIWPICIKQPYWWYVAQRLHQTSRGREGLHIASSAICEEWKRYAIHHTQ
jgi:hypothetical protein